MAEFKYETSNYIEDLFFTWIFSPLKFYNQTSPTPTNLFNIPKQASIEPALSTLKSNWSKELKNSDPSFFKAILKTIGLDLFISTFSVLIGNLLSLVQAILINFIIDYMSSSNKTKSKAVILAISFILTCVLSCCFKHNGSLRILMLTGKVKNLVAILVSEKVVRLNNASVSQESVKGKIINIISTDMEILELSVFAIYSLCAPFIVIFAIVIIIVFFGPLGIIGIAISLIHMPVVLYLGKLTMKIRLRCSKIGDTRVKMIQNLIEGIKIIKLYAWEIPLLKDIFNKRVLEISELIKTTHATALLSALGGYGTVFLLFVVLSIQVTAGNDLKPGNIYMLTSIYYLTHMNIVYVSTTGVNIMFAFNSIMKRVAQVMTLPDHKSIISKTDDESVISLKNVTFSWKNERKENKSDDLNKSTLGLLRSKAIVRECLFDLNFELKPKELLMVVGPVGCGKSSLFMGLLEEIFTKEGEVKLQGSIAYASEEPWVIAGSIKDNILMGKTLDGDLYETALSASALIADLNSFNNSDETLVGDKGYTLSGGQRARLCLARAIYSNSDIILLDDPLSAVDVEVANHLMTNCIKGTLKDKTVILATHQIHYLPLADKILVLNSGEAMFFGTYRELKENTEVRELLGDTAFRENDTKVEKTEKTIEKPTEIKEKLNIEEEEISDGVISIKSMWKYSKFGYKSIYAFIAVVILMILGQVSYVISIFWSSYWVKQPDQSSTYYIKIFAILVSICYFLGIFRCLVYMTRFMKSNVNLHNEALQKMSFSPSVFFDKNPTGRLLNRFSKDIGVVDGPLQFYLYESFSSTLFIVGNMIVLIVILPLNLVMVPFVIVSWYILLKYTSTLIIKLRKIELIARGPLISTITTALSGLPTLRCLNLQEMFIQTSYKHAVSHLQAYITFHVFMRFIQLYSDFFINFVVGLNVILIIFIDGYVDPSLAAFSISSSVALLGVSSVWSKNVVELSSNMSSAQRLLEFTDLLPEGSLSEQKEFSIKSGEIEFKDVYMRYRPNFELVLKGLSFKIPAGEKLGIIGRTGSGKSSILQVLFRLVNPESGAIYIDNQDIMSTGLHQLRSQMSVIPQNAILFSGTILENLDPFNHHSQDRILHILEEVKLKDYIFEHDHALNTEIKSEGISFSAGQKQLLCLARAVLRNNKVVMMDEATANVDNETDRLIQATVKKKFAECTLLIIAHRLRTIIDSHKVLVVDEGKCREFGTPAELFSQEKSLFKNMIMSTGPEESQFLISQI